MTSKARRQAAAYIDAANKVLFQVLLTSLYDDLVREFFVLHEVREAAKLAAVAEWIRSRDLQYRLPTRGAPTWRSPATLPGLMFVGHVAGLLQELPELADGHRRGAEPKIPGDIYFVRGPLIPRTAGVTFRMPHDE